MKNKRYLLVVFSMLLVLGMVKTTRTAGDGETLFIQKCGKCHKKGEAPVFAPVKYASSQWKRFFERKKHRRKADISDLFTDEEISRIKTYLINHAADSDRPIAAGLR